MPELCTDCRAFTIQHRGRADRRWNANPFIGAFTGVGQARERMYPVA
jgi:hypothetical protein